MSKHNFVVDLRPKMPPVWNQDRLSSCTAFALTAAVAYLHGFVGSQLWLYYKERLLEGSTNEDVGAAISDGIRVLASEGLPPLKEWAYNEDKYAKAPPAMVDEDAGKTLITSFAPLKSSADYLNCLQNGFPFVVGIMLYEGFESNETAASGLVSMPKPHEKLIGGHAICVVGYTDDGYYLVRNSWGPDWGIGGYFLLPEAYLEDASLATDAWVIKADREVI